MLKKINRNNVKFFIGLMFVLLIIPNNNLLIVKASPDLIDSYPSENQDALWNMKTNHPSADGNFSAVSQSFIASYDAEITSVKFNMRKVGAPTGNGLAKLYSHNGVYGSSSVPNVLLATSDVYDVSTISGDLTLIEFIFSGGEQYQVSLGTEYVILFEEPAAGVDADNYIRVGSDTSGSYGGNEATYSNGGWNAQASRDTIFYIYGNIIDTTGPTYSNPNTNTTLDGDPCKFQVTLLDETALDFGIFGTNNTGTWVNETAIDLGDATSYILNITKILNSTIGIRIEWQVWFNDTTNNWNDTGLQFFTIMDADVTIPTYRGDMDQNTSCTAGGLLQFNVTIEDEIQLDSYIMSFDNGNGIFNNETTVDISGLSYLVTHSLKVNMTEGVTCQWKIFFNDTGGNENVTDTHSFITTNSSTFSAWNGTAINVQEAVDDATAYSNANLNEVWVYIPDGPITFSETNGTLVSINIPQWGINIYGAGISSTILNLPHDNFAYNTLFFDVQGLVDDTLTNGTFTFSHIRLNGRPTRDTSNSSEKGIRLQSVKNFRIHHCNFTLMGGTAIWISDGQNMYGHNGGDWAYISWGLIDHCDFFHIYKPLTRAALLGYGYGIQVDHAVHRLWSTEIFPAGNISKVNDPFGIEESWEGDMKPFPTYGSYNYITYIEDCYFYDNRHATRSFGAGRYVLRHSTIDDLGQNSEVGMTGHPVRNNIFGNYAFEVYEVTFNDTGAIPDADWNAILVESGGALIYNNTFDSVRYCILLGDMEHNSNPEYPLGGTNYTFYWDNTELNLKVDTLQLIDNSGSGGDPPPTQNVNYFFYQPNNTQGDPYEYSAFTYPHPLVDGGPGINYHYEDNFVKGNSGNVNVTVGEWVSGVNSIKNVTITIETQNDAENFTLMYDYQLGTFSEISDPFDICTLNAGSSSNNTGIYGYQTTIVFNFMIDQTATGGFCDLSVQIYDEENKSDMRTWDNTIYLESIGWEGKIMGIIIILKIMGVEILKILIVNKVN